MIFLLLLSVASCADNAAPVEKILIDTKKLDSIRNSSDTGYTRTIGAGEFNRAEQYMNLKDSIVTKIMKDTAGRVIAFVQFKSGKKIDFAEFYPNGQLKAKLLLDDEGRFHGPAKYYYEDGRVQSEGNYNQGLYAGEWKNYNALGKIESVDEYDKNGQHMSNTRPR